MHPGADSNDTALIGHIDADITVSSNGKALTASGLPIPPLDYGGQRYQFGQANNALLYPGLGLGTIVRRAGGGLLPRQDFPTSACATVVPGGNSRVTVASDGPLPEDAVSAAPDEAGGYRITA